MNAALLAIEHFFLSGLHIKYQDSHLKYCQKKKTTILYFAQTTGILDFISVKPTLNLNLQNTQACILNKPFSVTSLNELPINH